MDTLAEPADLDRVAAAASALGELEPRTYRWAHLSLCVLDAVFSIGSVYNGTARAVWAYARDRELPYVLEPAARVAAGDYAAAEEPSVSPAEG